MTQEQLDTRKQRAERELLIISACEQGWRVRSAHDPATYYQVTRNDEDLQCDCPDFETQFPQDETWQCKHILAVRNHEANLESQNTGPEIPVAQPQDGNGLDYDARQPSHMLIKRSISPDGRIDSVSIEFTLPVANTSVGEIRNRALTALRLQTDIVRTFLDTSPTTESKEAAAEPEGAQGAKLLDVGVANGQYGPRYFLNVNVNGRRARLFGTASQIARAIGTAGRRIFPQDLVPGLRIDLPCRVLSQSSPDGRYLNVTQVFPHKANGETRWS